MNSIEFKVSAKIPKELTETIAWEVFLTNAEKQIKESLSLCWSMIDWEVINITDDGK